MESHGQDIYLATFYMLAWCLPSDSPTCKVPSIHDISAPMWKYGKK